MRLKLRPGKFYYMLVQWWRHVIIMLPHQHVIAGSIQIASTAWIGWSCRWSSNFSVCVTNEKDMPLQWQIWSTFVTVLWCSKTKITDGTRILIIVRVLWDMISKIFWQFWHSFFKYAKKLESSYNFNPIEITWRKMVCSVCLKPVSMVM